MDNCILSHFVHYIDCFNAMIINKTYLCFLFSSKISNHSCYRNRYLDAIAMIEEDSMDAQQIAKREKIIFKLKGK